MKKLQLWTWILLERPHGRCSPISDSSRRKTYTGACSEQWDSSAQEIRFYFCFSPCNSFSFEMQPPLAFCIYVLFLSDELWWYLLPVYSLGQVEFYSCKRLNLLISSAITQLLWHRFAFSDFKQLSLGHPLSLWWDKYQLAELYRSIIKEGKYLKMMCSIVF